MLFLHGGLNKDPNPYHEICLRVTEFIWWSEMCPLSEEYDLTPPDFMVGKSEKIVKREIESSIEALPHKCFKAYLNTRTQAVFLQLLSINKSDLDKANKQNKHASFSPGKMIGSVARVFRRSIPFSLVHSRNSRASRNSITLEHAACSSPENSESSSRIASRRDAIVDASQEHKQGSSPVISLTNNSKSLNNHGEWQESPHLESIDIPVSTLSENQGADSLASSPYHTPKMEDDSCPVPSDSLRADSKTVIDQRHASLEQEKLSKPVTSPVKQRGEGTTKARLLAQSMGGTHQGPSSVAVKKTSMAAKKDSS